MENEKIDKEKIFNELDILKNGSEEDKKFAFECYGILGNESTRESYENRLLYVEKIIEDYKNGEY